MNKKLEKKKILEINNPEHCLSRIICGYNTKIPSEVLEFQKKKKLEFNT